MTFTEIIIPPIFLAVGIIGALIFKYADPDRKRPRVKKQMHPADRAFLIMAALAIACFVAGFLSGAAA